MKQNEQIAYPIPVALTTRYLRPIGKVVQSEAIAQFEESMLEARNGLLGEVPESISCCCKFSNLLSRQETPEERTYGKTQLVLFSWLFEERTALEGHSKV